MTDPGSHPNRVPLLETLYSRQRGLLERLRVHQHNLDLLLLQQAKHGIDVPLRLLNEIEEQQRETLAIETELAGLDRKISTLMERAPSVSSSEPEVPNNRLGIWFKNEGDEYEVVAPYPFIGSTNIATPDKRMQTIGRFAGGFEVLSVMQTGQQGLTVSFLRHGRRISPVLDKQNRKILLPLGPHAIINSGGRCDIQLCDGDHEVVEAAASAAAQFVSN